MGRLKISDVRTQTSSLSREERAELCLLREAIRRLSASGRKDYTLPVSGSEITLGLFGDLHTGSCYNRDNAFAKFLEHCRKEKVDHLICAGDILDGCHVYPGHEYEIAAHGLEKQIALVGQWRSVTRKMNVAFVCGNHDLSFAKRCGVNPGELIADATGWQHIGDEYATIALRRAGVVYNVGVSHPSGTGTAYALSYRPQKVAESIMGGRKPHVLVIGHYHKAEYLPEYRNITIVQSGCFQAQTPFMQSRGIAAHVGGWILRVSFGEGTARTRGEFLGFYE